MGESHDILYVFVLRFRIHGHRRRVVDVIVKPRVPRVFPSYSDYDGIGPIKIHVPASQLPAPKFNLKLGPFYLSGNEVYTESKECNLVNNGKGDWNIKFDNSGEDLKGSLANPPCPF